VGTNSPPPTPGDVHILLHYLYVLFSYMIDYMPTGRTKIVITVVVAVAAVMYR